MTADADRADEYCCALSWQAAKDKAWQERVGKCNCDAHIEYCEVCYPLDFREGGKWSKKPTFSYERARRAEACAGLVAEAEALAKEFAGHPKSKMIRRLVEALKGDTAEPAGDRRPWIKL